MVHHQAALSVLRFTIIKSSQGQLWLEDKAFLKLLPKPGVPCMLTPAEAQQQHLGAGFATAPLHLQPAKAAQRETVGIIHRATEDKEAAASGE